MKKPYPEKLDTAKIMAGELIIITGGEWSDYDIIALVRALKDFDIVGVRSEYEGQYEGEFNYYCFEDWLSVQSYTEAVDVKEWALGNEGGINKLTAYQGKINAR